MGANQREGLIDFWEDVKGTIRRQIWNCIWLLGGTKWLVQQGGLATWKVEELRGENGKGSRKNCEWEENKEV